MVRLGIAWLAWFARWLGMRRMGDEDDYSFTAQRVLAWAMQHVVFGAVLGDAAMLEAALERDVYGLSADGAAAARERVADAGGGCCPSVVVHSALAAGGVGCLARW